ncbi:MAG: rod shape-determining protein RodA [Alphaproteobacteria bacterium]|nr:rod shape-determining protein RodA [Alphaproteobacteria bacterium]MBP7759210.1 rod shape-determining protein RodA [Alphaproteobacteria bacterium]MBP7762591.1 rod shape-determining protein RodA [Alphaproteobacteria bacterium]MBP7905108.1 rod shape-determining protein RodA [Alphaproteobacteria bacterium]
MIRDSMFLQPEQTLFQRFMNLNWGLVFLLCCVMGVGATSLYSAAGGSFSPWADKQLIRFCGGLVIMCAVALVDMRWWYRLAWPLYGVAFVLLILVDIMGHIGMGAQRWINLGFIQIQPSEIMKIAAMMALARHFHGAGPEQVRRLTFLIIPALLILAPVGLVMLQPDLGTAMLILMGGAAMVFIAGAPLWIFISGIAAGLAAIPIGWQFMHEYQKQRVYVFLNPELDPLGSGYHITQSKIALGSGGVYGKGFMEGTQSKLNFLPEKQTDFIFTLWAEEWGLFGGAFLLGLFALIFMTCLRIAMRCRHNFGRYLAVGLTVNFSLHVFINISMAMGLIPVVGIPLPMVSHGGTAMISTLIGFGLIMCCHVYRHSKVTR